jgi:hypothetical protein
MQDYPEEQLSRQVGRWPRLFIHDVCTPRTESGVRHLPCQRVLSRGPFTPFECLTCSRHTSYVRDLSNHRRVTLSKNKAGGLSENIR